MDSKEIYDVLKSVTLADIITVMIEKNGIKAETGTATEIYYTAKQLIELYPNIFSKYKIDKYIKYDNLPVLKNGKERFFLKSSVEMWLENKKNEAIFRRLDNG